VGETVADLMLPALAYKQGRRGKEEGYVQAQLQV